MPFDVCPKKDEEKSEIAEGGSFHEEWLICVSYHNS